MPDRTQMIRFRGSRGALLAARLDLPPGSPHACALFAHCFTCSKETLAAVRVSRALMQSGIAVLRFDFTGLGGSEGEFSNTNFSSNVDDLVAAANWLRDTHQPPKLLIGHSLGGAAVLAAAHAIREAAAVATIGAPADPGYVRRLLGASLAEIDERGEAQVTLGSGTFRITKQFLDDLDENKMRERIAALGKPLLVLHSPRDSIVDIANASQIFTAAKHPKSFVSLDTADHLLTSKHDAEYVAQVIRAWASRYLGPVVEEQKSAQAPSDGVMASELAGAKFAQEIRVGRHRLIVDEPVAVGGADGGPTPYDLLVAALGACTCMTLRLYAEAKKLPLDHVSVQLKHSKVHAEDCVECDAKDVKIDLIQREIQLEGALSDAERARLLEIADRCPVHRTLTSKVSVQTRLKARD
jgi:uncharacterized OsmC-like protein/fermentation-respiration switch protein FrsA (DUF1100 family)